MTGLVIRSLDESSAHEFDSLPDPLGVRAAHPLTRHRPDWQRVALRDGRIVARAAWWGGPDDTEPLCVDRLDMADAEVEAAAELLRSAPWRVDIDFSLPAGWRDDPALRTAVEARFGAARAAGYELLVERFTYVWTPECGLPERPGRLVFAPEPDDAVFFEALRRIHSVTLDAHSLKAIAEGGLDKAAQEELDFFRWCPSPREWWQVARTKDGDLVGIHVPARNFQSPVVGFIGVVPEQRGHGYAHDLLVECTHFLVEHGADRIVAATDRGNHPMAAHFAKVGYPVTRERVNFHHPDGTP
ncbi:GNAT family N-acetyltransferase [Streptomyces sp. S.PB5]|uniref:GNAT family N-acetyltransferase n=1 Tax=Streptomyces sp. S.PB5 TaxID=3020844 RepID=UPI0025B2737A|nr:GNAT family N-acetyltransferase [Streptomyces sp. S.PB5]MDN3027357.1 GNAT family N-acetyltransferase [Streptomyces sp. S.PB5]